MRYDVPRNNRQFAACPQVDCLRDVVERNRTLLGSHNFHVLDLPAGDFRRMCREEIQESAWGYGRLMGTSPVQRKDGPLIATGHQPEYPHAGVWIKGHLASRLAQAVNGGSINLVVDNDVPKYLGLSMPEAAEARRVIVTYAPVKSETAYEEHPPQLAQVDEFARETSRLARSTPFESQAAELVGRIAATSGRGRSAADVAAAVRVSYEQNAHVSNAELPVSYMSETRAFAAFVCSVALSAGEFARAYNDSLGEYRRENHVRYGANPVPDLAVERERVELPFWTWRSGQARQRLFARRSGNAVELYCQGERLCECRAGTAADAELLWGELREAGIKIRPRALSMTLFVRLFACDLFVHGIGGARYDEVTDRIIRRFYGVEPPAYAVITATMTIAWPVPPGDPSEIARLARMLRDIRHNPDRLPGDFGAGYREIIAEKRALIGRRASDRQARRAGWLRIREINAALSSHLGTLEADTRAGLDNALQRQATDAVLYGRDYPCFLLDREELVSFYDEILSPLGR